MIGLSKQKVKIVPHSPLWKQYFEIEKKNLRSIFSTNNYFLEHIGSTSIPNLGAKPIVDILLGIPSWNYLAEAKEKLKSKTYIFHPDKSDEERKFFSKGKNNIIYFHLHLVVYNNKEWNVLIQFRNILLENPSLRDQYLELKKKLCQKHADERAKYTAGKTEFILQTIAQKTSH